MRTIADTEDFQLLRRFVEMNSQEAFGELVNRHINLVYAVCLRETRDPTLAQDVAQAVFLTLFRKAPTIPKGTVLAGWLFNTSRFAAKDALRQEVRRKAIEESMEQEFIEAMSQSTGHVETWQAIEPLLHEAIASLGAKDRNAILLRYFEDKSLREVALALGTTEKAAQMRVARALEKLKRFLHKNGVAVPLTILASVLLDNAVQAAPVSCARASVSAASCASTTTKPHLISQEAMKSMFISKLKATSIVAALSVTGVVSTVYVSGMVPNRATEAPRPISTADNSLPSSNSILQKSAVSVLLSASVAQAKVAPQKALKLASVSQSLQLEGVEPSIRLGDDVGKLVRAYGFPTTVETTSRKESPAHKFKYVQSAKQNYNAVFTIRNNRVTHIDISRADAETSVK